MKLLNNGNNFDTSPSDNFRDIIPREMGRERGRKCLTHDEDKVLVERMGEERVR